MPRTRSLVLSAAVAAALSRRRRPDARRLEAQAKKPAGQRLDAVYTAKIKELTTDPRFITELVDHLPASDTVPSPLAMFGRIPGTPDELTYSKDVYRYFDALDAASDRVKVVRIGKTEEGREMITVIVADEATIRTLDKWKGITAQLTDPRGLADERRPGARSPPASRSTT